MKKHIVVKFTEREAVQVEYVLEIIQHDWNSPFQVAICERARKKVLSEINKQ